jgi:hypothetical protein
MRSDRPGIGTQAHSLQLVHSPVGCHVLGDEPAQPLRVLAMTT